MTNVVRFPKGKRALPPLALSMSGLKASLPKGSTVKAVFSLLFLVIRLPVFLVMYWLRLPVIFLCNLISVPMLLAWLFAWYAFPDKTAMVWGFATLSFLAFVVAWTYDFILMAIAPQDMVMTL